ncbi:MFS toxin efflux pump [Aspergillus cavernicola]|uniref:MFS toxin efflux pump n=1 Tax=Aspergillus cavernicola TaxID=176166 RepID=A0ABR4HF13_9EURO
MATDHPIAEKEVQTTKTTDMSPNNEAPVNELDHPNSPEKAATEKNGADAIAAAPDPTPEQALWKLICLTIALLLAMFCVSLDGTILATAIPEITNQFDSLDDVGWYGSSYLFTTCAVQLIFGKFYTFFNTKWVFIIAVSIFEVGSLVCGVAPNSIALIVGRSIAGIGAAGVFSGAIIAIAVCVPLRHRPVYTAILSTMHGVSSVAGPLLGGVFTDQSTWRWCFYINLPMGAITILFTMLFMPPLPAIQGGLHWKEQVKRLDLIGTLFLIPSVLLVLLALQWGGSKYPWNDGRVIALFVVSGVLAIVFFADQLWQKDRATIPLRLLKDRNVLGAAWFGISLGGSLFIFTYYLPIWFQAVKGVSATKSGIMNLPSILGLVIFSLVGGVLASWIGYYTPLLIASSVITAVGAGMLSTLKVDSSIGYWFSYQVLLALGAGLGAQNVMLVAQAAVPLTDMAMATTLLTFTQTLSGAVFLAVGQSVFQNQLIVKLHQYAPNVDTSAVIAGGVTAIRNHVSAAQLPSALAGYNDAIMQTFYVAVAMAALSVVGALCLEWVSLKASKQKISRPATTIIDH